MFDALKETPERDPARVAKGREQFLAQAKQISGQTVSVSWLSRLKDVFGPARPALQLSTLTIALVIGILLLGFSSSVVAAQQAQPDQLLYPYRLWLEDQRLALTSNPESRLKLHLQYAEERLEELRAASASLDDPAYDRTTTNFDRQISAANELLLQSQLNGSLKEKLESLDQTYRELFDDDDDLDDLDDDRESPEDDEDLDDDRDDDKIDPEELEDGEKPGKYQKEHDESDDDDDGTDGADDSDDPDDSNDSDESDSSDDDEPVQPDETDEPDDGGDGGGDDPEKND